MLCKILEQLPTQAHVWVELVKWSSVLFCISSSCPRSLRHKGWSCYSVAGYLPHTGKSLNSIPSPTVQNCLYILLEQRGEVYVFLGGSYRYSLWREKDFEGLGSLTSYIYVFLEVLEDAGGKYILEWERNCMHLDAVLASHYLLWGSSVITVSWRNMRPHSKYVHNINCGSFLTVNGNLTHAYRNNLRT